jgi:CBS domain-containing protein
MPQTAAAIKSARLWPERRRPAFIPANSVCTLPVRLEGGEARNGEPLAMRVSDVLQSNRQTLQTCIAEESIASICTRLSALNIGAFPVCDAKGALIGIISERDVVRAFARDGARLADMHVRDLMTREVETCGLETPMVEAEKLMNKRRVRHLPVMDGGRLAGMLSIRDVMVWRQREARDEVNVLRDAMIAVRNR